MRSPNRPTGSTRPLLALTFAAWAASVGCGDDAPQREGLAIVRFEATPARIMRGGRSVLAWEVRGAARLRLADTQGAILLEQEPAVAAGLADSGPLQGDASYILQIWDAQGGTTRATTVVDVTAPPPVFVESEAVPSQILSGQAAAIRWSTENALAVDVRTSTGAFVLEAGPSNGEVLVRPRGSSTYTLTARGVEGDATAMVTVRVGNQPPTIERFVAAPSTLAPGERVGLTWQVAGADEVSIRGVRTSTIVYRGPLERGSRTVRVDASESFALTAVGPGGTRSSTIAVTVRPNEALFIDRFEVEPNPAPRGSMPTAAWSVRGALQIELRQDGQVVQRTTQRTGRIPLTIAGDRALLTLTATASGARVTRSVEIFVHDVPVVRSFQVTPPAGSASTPRTVAWDVANVTQLQLFRGEAAVPGFPALTATTGPQRVAQGALPVTATVTSVYTLEATSAAAAQTRTALAVVGIEETEPNGSVATAVEAPLGGTTRDALGALSPVDVDVYAVTVPDGGSVVARTSSGPGRCEVNTRLSLIRNGVVVAFDDEGGTPPCSAIGPGTHPGAGLLEGGTYFVEVRGTGTGSYVLTLGPGDQLCGNGARESPETCDDGNRDAGDGCSARCGLETVGAVPPGGQLELQAPSAGAAAIVSLDVSRAGQSITATAASPSGTCDVVDTRLELLDPSGAVLVDVAGGGPIGPAGSCAALDPRRDRGARDLRAGRYFLRVRTENGASGPIAVAASLRNPTCGNRLLESRAGEQCDDGNVRAGDGCSATCQLEGGALPEVEVNDRQAEATPTGLIDVGRVQIRGEIRPSGDDDVYALEIPPSRSLRLSARTYTRSGQPTSCDSALTDTRLYVENAGVEASRPGSGELAFNDDLDPVNNVWCSSIQRLLLTGGTTGRTYYLRVQGWQDRGTATYFLDVQLTP